MTECQVAGQIELGGAYQLTWKSFSNLTSETRTEFKWLAVEVKHLNGTRVDELPLAGVEVQGF